MQFLKTRSSLLQVIGHFLDFNLIYWIPEAGGVILLLGPPLKECGKYVKIAVFRAAMARLWNYRTGIKSKLGCISKF